MDDYKWIIYLVASLLYFFFQKGGSKKKKRPKTTAEQQEESSNPSTFEELIEEMRGKRNRTPEVETQEAETIDSKDEIPELKDLVEERLMDQKTPERHLENADETLREMYKKGEKLKSLDELVDIEKVETRSERFDQFNTKKRKKSPLLKEIRADFANPKTARKAFIYGEIFNRKY